MFTLVLHFLERFPAIGTLMLLIILDIIGGLLVAFGAKRISSSASYKGMCKKAYMLLLVAMAAAIEPYAVVYPDGKALTLPLMSGVAIFFIVGEGISIMENAALLGIPIPMVLLDALVKLRDTTKNAEWQRRFGPTPSPVVLETIVNSRKHVDVSQHDTERGIATTINVQDTTKIKDDNE